MYVYVCWLSSTGVHIFHRDSPHTCERIHAQRSGQGVVVRRHLQGLCMQSTTHATQERQNTSELGRSLKARTVLKQQVAANSNWKSWPQTVVATPSSAA